MCRPRGRRSSGSKPAACSASSTRSTAADGPLRAGDKLLLYTDGIDGAAFRQQPVGLPSLLAAAEHFRDAPIGELVERLAHDLFTQTPQGDDLTIFGLEMLG